jgi:hypothetical protein
MWCVGSQARGEPRLRMRFNFLLRRVPPPSPPCARPQARARACGRLHSVRLGAGSGHAACAEAAAEGRVDK